jgi:hypothetical protein
MPESAQRRAVTFVKYNRSQGPDGDIYNFFIQPPIRDYTPDLLAETVLDPSSNEGEGRIGSILGIELRHSDDFATYGRITIEPGTELEGIVGNEPTRQAFRDALDPAWVLPSLQFDIRHGSGAEM